MTSVRAGLLAGPAVDADAAPAGGPDARPVLTGLDLLAGGALLVFSLLAWAALGLAHAGAHSVPAVLGVGLGGTLLVAVVAARSGRVRVRADAPGVVVALLCAAAAAALVFPGFSYGVSDKDPGGYAAACAT